MHKIIDIIKNARQHDIYIKREDMQPRVRGFVYPCPGGHYHVIVNICLSYDQQCKTAIHEVTHIINDLPNYIYYIGLDMQRHRLEKEANKIAEKIFNKIIK